MLIATRGVEFSFNNQMYKQLDGMVMGRPLGKALATVIVGFPESRLSDNNSKPGVYFRYVDDTFVFFGSELECDRFHVNLNQLHPTLNYTEEKEQTNSMNFLGVTVKTGALDFSPAFTGNKRLLVNISVGIPSAQKQGKSTLLKLCFIGHL